MNNAVFGKTFEIMSILLTKWEGRYGAEAMIAKPIFYSRSVFSENLVAVELRKLEMKFNKPIYIGMCILDIRHACIRVFHHEYMLLRCTATTMYLISWYRDIAKFDTSDYPVDNVYGMLSHANKKVPGLMKNEIIAR